MDILCSIGRMDKSEIDSVARHLLGSYDDTRTYVLRFLDDHERPPSTMAKAHHFRSVVQAVVVGDVDLTLDSEYEEFGRVQITDVTTGSAFLLRSSAAVAIEKATSAEQLVLWELPQTDPKSGLLLLVYRFDDEGLWLSVAATVKKPKSKRVFARHTPELVGFWPFATPDGFPPFDQSDDSPSSGSPFGDVGPLDNAFDDLDESGAAV